MELEISYKHTTTEAEKNPGLLLLTLPLPEMLLQMASRGLPLAQYTVSALPDNNNNSTVESPPVCSHCSRELHHIVVLLHQVNQLIIVNDQV